MAISKMYPTIDDTCENHFSHGVLLATNVALGLFVLSRMFGWCRDPVSYALQEKIDQLEEENRGLVEALNEANDELEEKCGTLQNLRDVLRIKRELDSDTESESSAKRRRLS